MRPPKKARLSKRIDSAAYVGRRTLFLFGKVRRAYVFAAYLAFWEVSRAHNRHPTPFIMGRKSSSLAPKMHAMARKLGIDARGLGAKKTKKPPRWAKRIVTSSTIDLTNLPEEIDLTAKYTLVEGPSGKFLIDDKGTAYRAVK